MLDVLLYALYGQAVLLMAVGLVSLIAWWNVPIRAFFELAKLARDAGRQGKQ